MAFSLKPLVFPAVLLGALELWTRTAGQGSDAIAPPTAALKALAGAATDGSLWHATGFTLRSAALGLLIGALAGLVLGTLLGLSRRAARAAYLSVEVARPIPSVALIPLAMLVFGFGLRMEVSVVAFACLWPMLVQHGDLLRGGSVDAVVSADPFMSRITDAGVGYVASYYSTFLPENQPTIIHTARREWAEKNPAAVKAFRDGVQEGAAFMLQPKNNDAVRAAIGKYIKLPPEVLAKVQISPPSPIVTERQLNYWVGLMKDQEMLKSTPTVAKLIVK